MTSTTEGFIEVSDEELSEEVDQEAAFPEVESPEEISEDHPADEKTSEGSSSETKQADVDENAASQETEMQEEIEEESSSAPAANEWEDFDAVRKTDGCFLSEKCNFPLDMQCALWCRRNWRCSTAPCRRSRATSRS